MDRFDARGRFRAIVAVVWIAGQAADLARRGRPAGMNELDLKALAQQLEDAAHHLLNALDHDPHWQRMPVHKRLWALDAHGSAHVRRLVDPECVDCLVLTAQRIIAVLHQHDHDDDAEREMCAALVHLDHALLLAQPDEHRRRIAASEPADRVPMGEYLNQIEQGVEYTRRMVTDEPA